MTNHALYVFSLAHAQVLSQLASADGSVGSSELRGLLWADFLIPGAEPQRYDEVSSLTRLSTVVEEYLTEYNAGETQGICAVHVIYRQYTSLSTTQVRHGSYVQYM